MNKYSRAKFRAWLESLPDEPFCPNECCPIAAYLIAENPNWKGDIASNEIGVTGHALGEDYRLARAIDRYIGDWRDSRPSQIISIIDEVEAA